MNRFHPICRAVEIPHAYDVEVAVKCLVHIPTCVRWHKESHLGWGLHTDKHGIRVGFRWEYRCVATTRNSLMDGLSRS